VYIANSHALQCFFFTSEALYSASLLKIIMFNVNYVISIFVAVCLSLGFLSKPAAAAESVV